VLDPFSGKRSRSHWDEYTTVDAHLEVGKACHENSDPGPCKMCNQIYTDSGLVFTPMEILESVNSPLAMEFNSTMRRIVPWLTAT
jgi:hypothetical protein